MDRIIRETARPVPMVDGHAVDGGQAVVIGEVEHDDMQDQGRVRCLDFMLRSEINGDLVLPVLELLVQLANGIEEFASRLPRGLGRIKSLVDAALDAGEFAHDPEEIQLALAVGKGDVTNAILGILAWELNIHIIVILRGGAARTDTEILVEDVRDPKDSLSLLDLDGVEIEAGALLVQADAVGQSNSGGDQEGRGLGVGGPLHEGRHAKQGLHTQKIVVPHDELRKDTHSILKVGP